MYRVSLMDLNTKQRKFAQTVDQHGTSALMEFKSLSAAGQFADIFTLADKRFCPKIVRVK